MLAKVTLLALIQNSTDHSVTGYFLGTVEKVLLTHEFMLWHSQLNTEMEIDLMLKTQMLEPIFVELEFDRDRAILNSVDNCKTVVKIHISLKTGILYAQRFSLAIYVSKNLLIKKGTLITKKFIAEILQC
jgi:hypothetical protein